MQRKAPFNLRLLRRLVCSDGRLTLGRLANAVQLKTRDEKLYEALEELRESGLVVVEHSGWGSTREVMITDDGRKRLMEEL
jgi:hypothetical protein